MPQQEGRKGPGYWYAPRAELNQLLMWVQKPDAPHAQYHAAEVVKPPWYIFIEISWDVYTDAQTCAAVMEATPPAGGKRSDTDGGWDFTRYEEGNEWRGKQKNQTLDCVCVWVGETCFHHPDRQCLVLCVCVCVCLWRMRRVVLHVTLNDRITHFPLSGTQITPLSAIIESFQG